MNKPLIAVIALVLIGGISWALFKPETLTTPAETREETSQLDITESAPEPEPEPETAPAPRTYYPIIGYTTRVTERAYGQFFEANKPGELPCGGQFSGYHTGDDLEVTSSELDPEVPVFAIADGKVRQFNRVNGYGGLLVIEHTIADQTMTANYGHVDLNQPKVAVGDSVKAGQIVAYLGAHCSTETNGERKHLHFAMHKGTTIDVKGYVQTKAELANWLNPAEFLKSLGAAEPQT